MKLLPHILAVVLLAVGSVHSEPVKLIFDTDMGNDVDDAIALSMIHAMQRRGACDLLAVTITKDHPKAAAYVDAMNTFYGYPDVPIGVVRNGATPEEGKFNKVADTKTEDGKLAYPHDLTSGEDAPEAVGLLRRILAAQPDGSVTLAQVGFFTNFARLLDSKPDDHSPLGGKALIEKKVKFLSIMAGSRPFVGTTATTNTMWSKTFPPPSISRRSGPRRLCGAVLKSASRPSIRTRASSRTSGTCRIIRSRTPTTSTIPRRTTGRPGIRRQFCMRCFLIAGISSCRLRAGS